MTSWTSLAIGYQSLVLGSEVIMCCDFKLSCCLKKFSYYFSNFLAVRRIRVIPNIHVYSFLLQNDVVCIITMVWAVKTPS